MYGFLGRNGADKSTGMLVVMGITRQNSGEVTLFGNSLKRDDPLLRRQVGYVAQEPHYYEWMTA